jgi:hypothetical protein
MDHSCAQGNPAVKGQCYIVRGTVSPSADIGMVLGVPNERTIVLWPPRGSDDYAPREVEGRLNDLIKSNVSIDGTFLVCPLPEQPNQFERGFLRYGCISKALDMQANHAN